MSSAGTETGLEAADIGVVAVYFVFVIGIGIYASCRASRGTVSGYFLAGRSMNFFVVGASLFVSNIGSEHFIGLAGSGAAGGIGVGAWEFNAILLLQLLGWVFLPVYIACQTYTMPEYLTKRFGGQRIRVYFAFLSLVLYIFTKCSVDLYTGGLFIQQSLKWDLYLSIIILILIVGILTITGGLTAVIYTDTLQALLMVGGALTLMGLGFKKLGGFDGMWAQYPYSFTNETVGNESCHMPNKNWNIMLREPNDNEMPWPGFLLGQTPGSIWYWCSDQVIVQRALAAKSLSHAQGATLMAGFIKILPLFIMVMPGMISRILYPDDVSCVDPERCYSICQSYAGCTNIAYPKLVLGIMPTGLKGLMMAVMIAALMSDLDSIFNSASTLFTIDIYKRIRKSASVREQMIVGRIFVLVMVAVSIAWVPVVKETQGGQVFIYIQEVTNYLAPPVAAVFLLGILWKRCNEKGAFFGLMAGFVTGVTRLVLVFIFPAPSKCGDADNRPAILKDFQYMYFAFLLFWITVIVAVIVSLITKPPDKRLLVRTTFWTRRDKEEVPQVMETYRKKSDDMAFDNPEVIPDDPEVAKENIGSQPEKEKASETKLSADEPEEKRGVKYFLLNWFCGVGKANDEEERLADEKANMISSLEQDRRVFWCLSVGLVFILCVGVALYIFWSLWNYWVEVPYSTIPEWKIRELEKYRPEFLNRTG